MNSAQACRRAARLRLTAPAWLMVLAVAVTATAVAAPAAQSSGIPSHQDLKYPPLPAVRLPDVASYTLANGMKLYLLEDHELPLISGAALVRTGNLFDPKDKVGLAAITGEVMRSGGTGAKTGDEIDEQLENIAAAVEASIGETSGSASFRCLKENIDEVLAVFKDVLTGPAFREDKLELAKTQYRSLISRRNDDASGIASREFSEILYGRDNPYGWRMEYEHIDNIGRDDLVAFHRRYFFPANVMLAVQGDFDPAEMKARIEKLFADWTVSQAPVPAFPDVQAAPTPRTFLAVKEDINQTFLRLGHLGGRLDDADYPALAVMADILGGGFSSRLFKKIRTELGYAYGVSAYWGANYQHPGVFSVSSSTKAGSTVATIGAVLAEIERIRTREVTDEELATAKDTVLNSFVFNFDSPSKTLNRLIRYEYFSYPRDFIFQYQKAVAGVTKADVLRVARQYLDPERFTLVAVGNPKEFDQPLASAGRPVVNVDLTIPQPRQEAATASDASRAAGKLILAKLQSAVGGAEKLAAVKDSTHVSEVQVQTPQGAMQVKQTAQWLAPSTFRQVQALPFGEMTAFFDGASGWLAAPQGVQPMPPPVIQQVRSSLLRNPFRLWLADRIEGLTVNAVSTEAIEVSDGHGQVVRLEIDPSTGLPLRQSYQTVQMAGAPAKMEDSFADWREVGGLKFPFKVTVTREGQPFADVTVQEIKLNSGLSGEALSRKP